MKRMSFIAAMKQHGLPAFWTLLWRAKAILHSRIPAHSALAQGRLCAGMTILTLGTVLILSITHPSKTYAAGPYKIDWYTIDGGGGTSSGGPFVLTGTIGQPDTGYSANARYEVLGGFWPGGPICTVGFDDFARFAEQWFYAASGLAGDLDSDGDVDFDDLTRMAGYWLECCPSSWPLK